MTSDTTLTCQDLLQNFPEYFVNSEGPLSRKIKDISSPEQATNESMIFLATNKALVDGLHSKAHVIVVPPSAFSSVVSRVQDKTILVATNVEVAMAKVISKFFLKTPYTNVKFEGIHSTAVISPLAQLDPSVRVGPHAVIGAGTVIKKNVYVGANAVIENNVEIDENTVVHPLAFIGHSCLIGKNCEIHPSSVIGKEGFGYAHDERWNHYRIPHQGRVVLEDDVHVGACCTIDRGTFNETRIRTGSKLDNQIHIAHNCEIGKNSLLTAGFTMAGSSKIGANFVAGGKTVVTGHIEVCDNVQVAALSAISKGIQSPGQYGGNPLQPLQQFIKTKAAMIQLPSMRKQLQKIAKHLGLEEEKQ